MDLRGEEPRRALVSLEMILRGNYIVPTFHNCQYYNKLPFFNWAICLLFNLFGSYADWIVRVPSVLGYFATALLMFFAFKKYVNRNVAVFSVLFFLTFFDLLFFASVVTGEIDLFLIMLIFLQVFSIFHFFQKKKYWLLFLTSYFFMTIGFFTKGLPSLAIQVITILAVFIYHKKIWKLLSVQHFAGIVLFFGLGIGYFYVYQLNGGDYLVYICKTVGEASQQSGIEQKWWGAILAVFQFPVTFFVLGLPWALFLVFIIFKPKFLELKSNPLLVFSLLFIAANILVYCFTPNIKKRYLFPFLPFYTLIIAFVYDKLKAQNAKLNSYIEILFGVLIVISGLGIISLNFVEHFKIVDFRWGYTAIFVAMIGAIFFCYRKYKSLRIYLLVLALAVVRLAYNFMYLPVLQVELNVYKQNIKDILEISEDKPIYLFGEVRKASAEVPFQEILFPKMEENIFEYPPVIAYQIPFYYTGATKRILEYHQIPEKGNYYIAVNDRLFNEYNFEILFEFYDFSVNRELYLVKY